MRNHQEYDVMKAAFSVWNNRIAPVFDVARKVLLVDMENRSAVNCCEACLLCDTDEGKAKRLCELDVDVLICGAVSRYLETTLVNAGIQVIGFVAGDALEIIDSWLCGDFQRKDYAMPGCCCRGIVSNELGLIPKEVIMNGRGAGRCRQQGMGQGMGQGKGQGMGRRMGQGNPQGRQNAETEAAMGKIAVSCEEPSLDAMIDPRFGRAAGYLIVDPDTMQFEYLDNGASQAMAQGAGIQAAETVFRSGAKTVLTGYVGPKAFQALSAAGIQVIQNVENMSVRQAIEGFKAGRFQPATEPNRMGHGR
ncbi:NifB/NifX family molybdenum-iron cluster-binding protein [Desulfatirhabdium butyrativorans]|uniref:NifB/NifX family molybdenum-iron cluster-binding protein n=1 Tax=Desulfatirhabdium butyrativorans TaxID=340467 RepID=UPI0004275B40|nr:NifB/NifX family molybdenum-iron cluster-binding protein [Desulfatirhabdium butyrativorans]